MATGISWLSSEQACDMLRVGIDNAELVDAIAQAVPDYVERVTGFPATLIQQGDCNESVQQLVRFLIVQWFNPDGTDADKLQRVIDDLIRVAKVDTITYDLEERWWDRIDWHR